MWISFKHWQNLLDVGVVNNLVGFGGGGARDVAANQNAVNNEEEVHEGEEEIEDDNADNGNNGAQGKHLEQMSMISNWLQTY